MSTYTEKHKEYYQEENSKEVYIRQGIDSLGRIRSWVGQENK